MKRIWKQVVLILVLCLMSSFTVYGQGKVQTQVQNSMQTQDGEQLPRLVDYAGLLSQDEAELLLNQLDEISERQQFDVVVVTMDSLPDWNIETVADDFYDYNGYGQGDNDDGILFLISVKEREWTISTSGFGIRAFTNAGQEYMVKKFRSDLSAGNYYDAFVKFAKWSDDFVTQAKEGKPYGEGHLPVAASDIIFCAIIGLLAGLVLAFLRVWMMKWQMRTVYHHAEATNYLVDGSCRMQDSRERLVRKTVSRIHIQRETHSGGGGGSMTHTSSSGRTHGGSHGKF